jgi:hypothetical protein
LEQAAEHWQAKQQTYNGFLEKGRAKWDEFQAFVQQYQMSTPAKTSSRENGKKQAASDQRFQESYSSSLAGPTDQSYEVKTVHQGIQDAYKNKFDVEGGIVTASANFSQHDEARKAGAGLPNSEILWQQHGWRP